MYKTPDQQIASNIFSMYDLPFPMYFRYSISHETYSYLINYPFNKRALYLIDTWNEYQHEPGYAQELLESDQPRGLNYILNLITVSTPIQTWKLNPNYQSTTPKVYHDFSLLLNKDSLGYYYNLALKLNLVPTKILTLGPTQIINKRSQYISAAINAIGLLYTTCYA